MKERVKKNEYFFSGGDNRKEQHKLYNECYKIATLQQKKKIYSLPVKLILI